MNKNYIIGIIVIIIIASGVWFFASKNTAQAPEAPAIIPTTTTVVPTGEPNIPAGTSISNEVGG